MKLTAEQQKAFETMRAFLPQNPDYGSIAAHPVLDAMCDEYPPARCCGRM